MANGVYWIGQNGKTYMKVEGGNGVQEWFAPLKSPEQMGLQRIDDPVNPTGQVQGAATTAPSGAAAGPKLNQAAVDATNQAIGSLDVERDTGYRNIDDSFNSLLSKYDKEAARTGEDYTEQTETNTNNLTKNKQNALLAAAQGRRGLRGTLSAIGALSGDGSVLADRAVTQGANQDIGEAADTFAGNASTLDKAKKRFDEEDADRRAEAQTTRTNQRTALEGSIASKRQNFFQKLAEIYAGGGRDAEANANLAAAGNLNNEIASKTRVAATPFTARSAAFTPGDLESYLAGAGDMTVDVTSGDGGGMNPGQLLAGRKKKEERELVGATA
jgi:hypothetical protein